MALVTLPNSDSKFQTGQPAYGTDVSGNINALLNDYNGNITNANISASAAITDSKLAQITTSNKVATSALTGNMPTVGITADLVFKIDGGGSAIATGSAGYLGPIDLAGTLNSVTIVSDTSTSTVVDIKKSAAPTYPATSITTSSICASAKPTLSSKVAAQDTTLTGWTTAIAVGDILEYNVDSNSAATKLTITLKLTRS